MSLAQLAAYVAPIYWFSPDEPSLNGKSGADIRIPEAMLGESLPPRPVVYYEVTRVHTRPDAKGASVVRNAADPGSTVLVFNNIALITISFFAYFHSEEGLGAHPHDIEPADFRIALLPSNWSGFSEWIPGGAKCDKKTYVMGVTRVQAKAHGLVWFWNVLDLDVYTQLPMTLLVEEGKHALATDKNGDGVFTKGYDVNRRVNDAWGTRDIIRSGMLFSGGYESWMTKVRRPEYRVFPPLPEDSPLQPQLRRRMQGGHYAVYELRTFPPLSFAGNDAHLAHLMSDKEVANWPTEEGLRDAKRFTRAVEEGGVVKSLSIAARFEGQTGLVWAFPFFIVKHLEDPMTGGYILQRMYVKDVNWRDFGWMALYTPSASRWLDTYLSAGAEMDKEPDSTGTIVADWDFVFETGLKFRVNVNETPVKFLHVLTDYWGLRLGIKQRGFFDINHLSYVIEFGAGSF